MNFILNILVLPGMRRQVFRVPISLTGPVTLKIQPGDLGLGHKISILDEAGELRVWFAAELYDLYFEGP